MKKILLGALLLTAASGLAQESRQDVSLSATGVFSSRVDANGVHETTQPWFGSLLSYRYMVTPHSALEANYGFSQYSTSFTSSFIHGDFHTRQQEFSLGYVYSVNFKNFNPFVEGGPAAVMFTPLRDFQTNNFDGKRNTRIGGMFGVGIAYELSPSFDIRAEYRGLVVKTPDFSLPNDIFKTNRYEVVQTPSIGVAYHF